VISFTHFTSGLHAAALVFFKRPDVALDCFILILCAPGIAFVELQHRKLKQRRRERLEATGFTESYETVAERLRSVTSYRWVEPAPVDRPGVN
jgi:hypothetical protein